LTLVPIDFAFQAMAERSDRAPARWRRPLLRWLDGVEAGWAVPLLIAKPGRWAGISPSAITSIRR
jgi:hypothetical protein